LNAAASDLKKIYGGDWASLLATVSTDEDFVETYELLALRDMGAPLSSLQVTIPPAPSTGSTVKSISQYLLDPTTDLYKKARWIELCL